MAGFEIIAEVKTASPFGWRADRSWDELFDVANRVGDIISIHTNSAWNGSIDLIRKARDLTDKPLLAKGLHETDAEVEEAIRAGADLVLVVGRIPQIYQDHCLIEPSSIDEISDLPDTTKLVWNSRDLATGGLKSVLFEEVREAWPGWLCQASNIETIDDVHPGADAVLVGTYLNEFALSALK